MEVHRFRSLYDELDLMIPTPFTFLELMIQQLQTASESKYGEGALRDDWAKVGWVEGCEESLEVRTELS